MPQEPGRAKGRESAVRVSFDGITVLQEGLVEVTGRVRYHMLQMSDALRGFLLDPENDAERELKAAADEDLVRSIKSAAALLADRPELRRALEGSGSSTRKS